MKIIRMPRPNEQRKVEALLVKLAHMKLNSSKATPLPSAVRTA
jgi:hypothetical protein